MCFRNDRAEWTASVYEEGSFIAIKETSCDECRETIPVGAIVHHIHMEEHDGCQTCFDGECECPLETEVDVDTGASYATRSCCDCPEPDYGETEEYSCCDNCDKFLKSVEKVESAAGCKGDSTRPDLTMMVEQISNGDWEEAARFVKQAKADYPELAKSGYLGRLWKRMF